MNYVYYGTLAFFELVMVACCIVTAKRKNEYSSHLLHLFSVAILTSATYTTFLLTKRVVVATLFDGFYFICTDFLMFFTYRFVVRYTDAKDKVKMSYVIFALFAIADMVSMTVNAWTHHLYTLEYTHFDKFALNFWAINIKWPFYLHLAFCYVYALLTVVLLIRKLITAPKLYKRKYLVMLLPVIVVAGVNGLCFALKVPLDLSIISYAAFAILIWYFAVIAVPQGLVENILSRVVETGKEGLVCFDTKGKCVFVNNVSKALMRTDDWGDFDSMYEGVLSHLPDSEMDYHEWYDVRESENGTCHYNVIYSRLKDAKGKYIGSYVKYDDRTGEIKRFKREQFIATHDSFTGLYNKDEFCKKVRDMLMMEPEVPRYMLCSNIKDFKLVNDLFGIEKGNEVILKQAEYIEKFATQGNVYGRIGGDKFAMCMPIANFHEEVFLNSIKAMQTLTEGSVYKLHVYIGVYEITDPEEEPRVMIDKANLAIDSIKGSYSQSIVYYDKDLIDRILYEKTIVSEFDDAIAQKQFEMYLQPQVNVYGELLGAEALVRWKHPERGLVFPGEFIDVFERSGIIHKLDRYIWELAAKQLSIWSAKGREDLHISVNISAKDFYYIDIYSTMTELVEKYKIAPERLKLEITESAIMQNSKETLSVMKRLREYGFCMEIDDFGSGYSSLNMLMDIEADVLKLDMGFLRKTENAERSQIIMDSVVEMAKALGHVVVSEGVETEHQVAKLSNIGCDVFQGYYFSKPITVYDFEQKYYI